MPEKIIPTLTLAELYETQNQLLDALVIYQKLQNRDPNNDLRDKIAALKEKIYSELGTEFNPVIDQVFSEEDKRRFNLLPHKFFKSAFDQLDTEELESMADFVDLEEQPDDIDKQPDFEQEQISEPEKPDSATIPVPAQEEEKITDSEQDFPETHTEPKSATEITPEVSEEKTEATVKSDSKEELTDSDFFDLPFEDLAQSFRQSAKEVEDEEIVDKTDTTISDDVIESQVETSSPEPEPIIEESSRISEESASPSISTEEMSFEDLVKQLEESETKQKEEEITAEEKETAENIIEEMPEKELSSEEISVEELEEELKAEFRLQRKQIDIDEVILTKESDLTGSDLDETIVLPEESAEKEMEKDLKSPEDDLLSGFDKESFEPDDLPEPKPDSYFSEDLSFGEEELKSPPEEEIKSDNRDDSLLESFEKEIPALKADDIIKYKKNEDQKTKDQ